MPRAPFDTTCDLIWGPGHPGAGTIRIADVPCRLVVSTVIDELEFPLYLETHYLTMEVMPFGYGVWFGFDAFFNLIQSWAFEFSDLVAIPAGTTPTHGVIWTENVPALGSQATYWRARITPLPLPTTHP